jgi:hypothetical protein
LIAPAWRPHRLGHGLGFFGLLGHQHLLGRGHHRADGRGFGFGLAAALAQIGSRRTAFFIGDAALDSAAALASRASLGCRERRAAAAAVHSAASCGRYDRRSHVDSEFLGLFLASVAAQPGGSALRRLALARFLLLALAALFGQLFFLAADQFGLPTGFFLAAGELGVVNERGRGASGTSGSGASTTAVSEPSSRLMKVRFLRTSTWMVRALPVASACLISLVDFFTRVIFLRSGEAVPWLACR